MSDSTKTQTIEELKAQVADLKAARTEELLAQAEDRKQNEELEQLKRQKEALESGNIPTCLLYTSPSPRDATLSRMPSSA